MEATCYAHKEPVCFYTIPEVQVDEKDKFVIPWGKVDEDSRKWICGAPFPFYFCKKEEKGEGHGNQHITNAYMHPDIHNQVKPT